MSDWRLFIAVELPEAALEVLAAVERDLAQSGADVKWSDAKNIHLTLKFLGDTPEGEVAQLSAALDEAAAKSTPSVARLAEVGAFPNIRRPRIVWVGLAEPTGELALLQKRVDEAASYLVPPDARGFTAHLTLGRVRSGKNLARLTALLEGYRLESNPPAGLPARASQRSAASQSSTVAGEAGIDIPVNEVVLIRSVLDRSGPTYTPLHRSPVGSASR